MTMREIHTEFKEGYKIHLNLTNGLVAFVTPFCQVFVEKKHIRLAGQIGENYIFMPQSTLLLYHLPLSVITGSGREREIKIFFGEKLPQ